MNRNLKIALGAVVAVVVLVVGGTWVYINVIKDEAPEKLTLDDSSGSTSETTVAPDDATATTVAGSSDGIDGTWSATGDSVVGYRVPEILFGQSTEGVGRTSDVTGSMTISGTTISEAEFEVDMTTVKSDSGNRDNQFNGRIMDTEQFPTSTFTLTSPIDLGSVPADGVEITATATGELTLKGKTQTVDLEMTAKRDGDTISTLSNYTVIFADWDIDNPSAGPAEVGDEGTLEIKLVFGRS